MISILLILILVFGFFMGMKRGFILQLMHLISFIIAFTVAVLYYKKLAPNLVSWIPYPDITSEQSWAIFLDSMPMENAFYNAIAFALIFFGTKINLKNIHSMLDFCARIPVPDITSEQSWAIFVDSMPMENALYNAIEFALIFFGTKIILQIIASMLDFVARLPVLKQLNKLLGAILGFVEVYLILFVLLYVVALTPVGKLQGYVADSFVARLIVEFTPFLSSAMESLWFTDVLGKLF